MCTILFMSLITIVIIAVGSIIATIIIINVLTISTTRKKTVSQVEILADELDRQRRDNVHFRQELKRITSMDNIFFASVIRLTSRLKIEDIAKEITGLVTSFLDAREVAVLLADVGEKRLTIVDQRGLNEDWIPKLVYEPDDKDRKGKIGLCFEKKLPIGPREFAVARIQEPYEVFYPDICYPLFFQNKKFGVIAITRKQDLDERERSLLGVVSAIAGVALNNTHSFEDITLTAQTDPLTKLYNIGYFRGRLEDELNRAKRFRHTISVVIIDLDNFKTFNDTLGHQAGDRLLIQLSQIFTKHFDKTDTIARYGGDEFIVMCPEIKKQETARVVGNLLHDLEMYDSVRGPKDVKVTFSAGVSSYPEDGGSVAELIKAADTALYEAKGAGRNTVRVYRRQIDTI
jgi:diguanylate cyclase (GGDEF)-like protein